MAVEKPTFPPFPKTPHPKNPFLKPQRFQLFSVGFRIQRLGGVGKEKSRISPLPPRPFPDGSGTWIWDRRREFRERPPRVIPEFILAPSPGFVFIFGMIQGFLTPVFNSTFQESRARPGWEAGESLPVRSGREFLPLPPSCSQNSQNLCSESESLGIFGSVAAFPADLSRWEHDPEPEEFCCVGKERIYSTATAGDLGLPPPPAKNREASGRIREIRALPGKIPSKSPRGLRHESKGRGGGDPNIGNLSGNSGIPAPGTHHNHSSVQSSFQAFPTPPTRIPERGKKFPLRAKKTQKITF